MHVFLEDDEGIVITMGYNEVIILHPKRAAMALFKDAMKVERNITRLNYTGAFTIELKNKPKITLFKHVTLNQKDWWNEMIVEFDRLVKLKAFA